VLLAIDAVPAAYLFDPERRAVLPSDEDAAGTRASTRKLAELAHRVGAALVVFGHDADQWPTLRHAPEAYE
jgi:N-acyl homoserine lactone hydrolase